MTAAASGIPARFVITGPTGWIGRALLALLYKAGDPDALAPGESVALFGSRAGTIAVHGGPDLPITPLAQIGAADVAGAHVVHLAYLTKDRLGQMSEDAFARTNTTIDQCVLDAITGAPPASLFVASSGAARQAENGLDRNAYGLAKLEQETRFLAYAKSSGVAVLCGRIFNLAGPHINKLQDYAVSNFALQAMRGDTISIAAAQPVFRSFLHVEDLCRMIVRAARARLGQHKVIDLCGHEVLEIQDIAARVGRAVGNGFRIDRHVVTFAGESAYVGQPIDSLVLAMRLNLCLKGFDEQLKDTLTWMRALGEQSVIEA